MLSEFVTIEAMDQKMNGFHQEFKARIQDYKTQLLDSRTQHQTAYEELISRQNETKKKIEKLSEDEMKVKELINSELSALNDAKLKIDELKGNEAALKANRDSIANKIAILNNQISTKKTELSSSKKDLSRNVQKDLDLVKLYESFLGLKIDTVEDDIIKFIFFNLLQNDLDRSFEIALDLSDSQGAYKIASMSYELPQADINSYLSTLNATRSLVLFLKNVRKCFINNYKG